MKHKRAEIINEGNSIDGSTKDQKYDKTRDCLISGE